MDEIGLKELLTHVIGDIAKALSERNGESRDQQIGRLQAATYAIMAFSPNDPIQLILAGHCVMFHALIVDSVRATLSGQPEATRRATRSGIVAMNRAFANNLARLERRQAAP